MGKIKLFLFTCVKNGRQYIGRLFDSLLEQTNTDFVHFIYDNGSNDFIEDLVLEYKEKASKLSKPFEVIYEKTSEAVGLNMATKYCIARCNKPYFIWIDCDNWVHKDFFKHLVEAIKKHPNHTLFRTFLVKVDGNSGEMSSNFKERKLSLTTQNNAAFTFFTRKNRYYYSFFAVNTKHYMNVSNNNLLDVREYYNDEQVLAYCYLAKGKVLMVKKSIGYYLARNDSEAHLIKPSQNIAKLFAYDTRVDIAKNISEDALNYYLIIDELFKEYNSMQNAYANKKFNDAKHHFKCLCMISMKNHFSKKITFRNKDYFYWLYALYFKFRRK